MGTGPDGQLECFWDEGNHCLSMEFAPEKDVEFFYRDRKAEISFLEYWIIGQELPEAVKNVMHYFCPQEMQ